MIKKIKNTAPWKYVISDLKGKKIVGTSYENKLQKKKQKKSRVDKVIKKS